MNTATLSRKDAYRFMFRDYPDVVNIEQMCRMLGGFGKKTGYRLLRENKIEAFRIGKSYKIPKIQVMNYLKVIEKQDIGSQSPAP